MHFSLQHDFTVTYRLLLTREISAAIVVTHSSLCVSRNNALTAVGMTALMGYHFGHGILQSNHRRESTESQMP